MFKSLPCGGQCRWNALRVNWIIIRSAAVNSCFSYVLYSPVLFLGLANVLRQNAIGSVDGGGGGGIPSSFSHKGRTEWPTHSSAEHVNWTMGTEFAIALPRSEIGHIDSMPGRFNCLQCGALPTRQGGRVWRDGLEWIWSLKWKWASAGVGN